jgi:hypothetical protein
MYNVHALIYHLEILNTCFDSFDFDVKRSKIKIVFDTAHIGAAYHEDSLGHLNRRASHLRGPAQCLTSVTEPRATIFKAANEMGITIPRVAPSPIDRLPLSPPPPRSHVACAPA